MAVEVAGIVKRYGGAPVLDGVDLRIEAGQVRALLGPNGAGKSTLIRCLTGAVTPDAGALRLDGDELDAATPARALAAGVVVIYQHLSLISALTVSENVFLGSELRRGPFVARAAQRHRTREVLTLLGVDAEVGPDVRVGDLPIALQQLVEIAKALHRNDVRLLILDEPTSALSETEARQLISRVRGLRARGIHVLYVTHLLDEVFEVADSVTVLRDGRVVLDKTVGETDRDELVGAIAGVAVQEDRREGRVRAGEAVLELRGLRGPRFGPVDLRVGAGEVVGLFGMVGSGRTELLETLFGARQAVGGDARFRGRRHRPANPAGAIAAGIALVPSDRLRQSLFAELSALENSLLPSFRALSRLGLRQRDRERDRFAAAAGDVRLHPAEPRMPARILSGGNQQKLVVGRWLALPGRVALLLLDEPTQGIDVGARHDLYRLLRQLARDGTGVLFASSDPDEARALADRVVVLSRGRVVAQLRAAAASNERLLGLAGSSGAGPPEVPA